MALFICNLLVNSFPCCEAPGGFGDGKTLGPGEFQPPRMA